MLNHSDKIRIQSYQAWSYQSSHLGSRRSQSFICKFCDVAFAKLLLFLHPQALGLRFQPGPEWRWRASIAWDGRPAIPASWFQFKFTALALWVFCDLRRLSPEQIVHCVGPHGRLSGSFLLLREKSFKNHRPSLVPLPKAFHIFRTGVRSFASLHYSCYHKVFNCRPKTGFNLDIIRSIECYCITPREELGSHESVNLIIIDVELMALRRFPIRKANKASHFCGFSEWSATTGRRHVNVVGCVPCPSKTPSLYTFVCSVIKAKRASESITTGSCRFREPQCLPLRTSFTLPSLLLVLCSVPFPSTGTLKVS